MTTRPSRSSISGVPMPRTSSSTSPGRNLDSVISIPISAGVIRPRLPSNQGFPQRSTIADDLRGLVRVPVSPSRPTSRSYTNASSVPIRPPRVSTAVFEPRVVRRDALHGAENPCLPSSSTTTTRARRASAAGIRTLTTPRHPTGPIATLFNPAPVSFPRPAYLEHSSLRHLLQTELPTQPHGTRSSVDGSRLLRGRNSISVSTDSDDDSSASVSSGPVLGPSHSSASASTDPIIKLPTRWDVQHRYPSLSVSSDGRDLSFHGASEKDAVAARANNPAPSACGIYYYEVEIVNKGQKGNISVGFAADNVKLSRPPGWEKNSWGYHVNDGCCYPGDKNGTPYGQKFETGDIMGCGIDFSVNRIFYTRNGTHQGLVFENVGKDIKICPSVGLGHAGEVIRANFGHEPFKYDIENYVAQQRNLHWAKIMSTPLDVTLIDGGGRSNNWKGTSRGPVSEEEIKGPLNRLILSYLAHHGYVKTARAFKAQSENRGGTLEVPPAPSASEDHDLDMDGIPRRTASGFGGKGAGIDEHEMELRTNIVNSVITGDLDTALSETQRHFPAALEADEGLILVKLRLRKFVEMILESSEMKKKMRAEEAAMADKELDGGTSAEVDGMDVDDDDIDIALSIPLPSTITNGHAGSSHRRKSISPGRPHSSAAVAQYESALNKAIHYGQELQKDYKPDSRPEVQSIFKPTFGILAWVDPLEAGPEVTEIVGQKARVLLANDLNQAILKSQGRPGHPALEMLYKQTAACIIQLGLEGVGAAAFADMPKEFLDA